MSTSTAQDHDHEDLLRILQAHGHKFMSLFSSYESPQKKRKRANDGGKGRKKASKLSDLENSDGEEEEWVGINLSDDTQGISDNESEGSRRQSLLLILGYVSSGSLQTSSKRMMH